MIGAMPIAILLVWTFLAGLGLGAALLVLARDVIAWDLARRRTAGPRPGQPAPDASRASASRRLPPRPGWQYLGRLWPDRPAARMEPVKRPRPAPDRPRYEDPYAAGPAARPVTGHPVLEGAGYDCCCGSCLAQPGYVPRVMAPADRIGAGSAPWSPAAPPEGPYDLDRAAASRRRRGRLPAAYESGNLPAVMPGMEPTSLHRGALS